MLFRSAHRDLHSFPTRRSSDLLPIALAVTKGLTVADLAQTFAIYPSLSGSITEAGRRLMGADHLA